MTNIYNLFKFLEDKEGKEVPSKVKIVYAPETFFKENLIIKGDLNLGNTTITSLPPGLEVRGTLYLESSEVASLPENLKVGGNLWLQGTKITTLPKGLEVGAILDLNNTKIESLPEDLKVGKFLYLRNSGVTSLPSSLKVGDTIYIGGGRLKPEGIPVNLREKIDWYGGTFEDYENYIKMGTVKLPGTKVEVPGSEKPITSKQDIIPFVSEDNPELQEYLLEQPLESFKGYTIFKPDRSFSQQLQRQDILYVTLPDVPLPLRLIKTIQRWGSNYEIQYKTKRKLDTSFQGTVTARGLEKALQGLGVPIGDIEQESKLTRDENGKLLRLSQVIDREQQPVSMDIGTRKRGGLGVKGEYKDYAPTFSTAAQNNLASIAKKGIEWKDFIAYRFNNNGDANFVVRGVSKDGRNYYYNRYGSGMGGASRLYNDKFEEIPQ